MALSGIENCSADGNPVRIADIQSVKPIPGAQILVRKYCTRVGTEVPISVRTTSDGQRRLVCGRTSANPGMPQCGFNTTGSEPQKLNVTTNPLPFIARR